MDDSTAFQVYMNCEGDAKGAVRAVNDTKKSSVDV